MTRRKQPCSIVDVALLWSSLLLVLVLSKILLAALKLDHIPFTFHGTMIAGVGVYMLIAWTVNGDLRHLNLRVKYDDIGSSVCAAFVGYLMRKAMAHAIYRWFPPLKGPRSTVESLCSGGTSYNALSLAAAIFLAPMWEEVVFHGVIYTAIVNSVPGKRKTRMCVAVVISSALFAWAHEGTIWFWTYFISSLATDGFLRAHTNRLGACVIEHICANAIVTFAWAMNA